MDRAPGLSVRLKLTLSYAGFLMLAGALLLVAVWAFLLRYVPDRALLVPGSPGPPTGVFPIRSILLHVFGVVAWSARETYHEQIDQLDAESRSTAATVVVYLERGLSIDALAVTGPEGGDGG